MKFNRPRLNKHSIDWNHPKVVSLLKEYSEWYKKNVVHCNVDDYMDTCKSDMVDVLCDYRIDAYEIVRFLEEYGFIHGNTELVRIMEQVPLTRSSLLKELEEKWVKDNKFKIRKEFINKKVLYRNHRSDLKVGYIVKTDQQTFKVLIGETLDSKKLLIVPFENVTQKIEDD